MKYYTRRATAFDFHVVFSGLSEVSAFEFCRDGASWWKAMRACLDLHALCPAEAVVRVDAKGHDETIALFGHNQHPTNKKERVTWFAGSPEFFSGAGPTLFARRYLQSLGAKWPGTIFNSYSRSRHPGMYRWFEALGYRLSGYHDGYARFLYCRPAKPQVLGAA